MKKKGKIKLPVIPEYASHNAHLFYIILKDETTRNYVMAKLKEQGIHAYFHYVPLHSAPCARRLEFEEQNLHVTKNMSRRLLRFPMYANMNDNHINYILNSIDKLFNTV